MSEIMQLRFTCGRSIPIEQQRARVDTLIRCYLEILTLTGSPLPLTFAIDLGVPRFAVGRVACTSAVSFAVPLAERLMAINHHFRNDWRNVRRDDFNLEPTRLTSMPRMMSIYTSNDRIVFWIVTDPARYTSTVLLPYEYEHLNSDAMECQL